MEQIAAQPNVVKDGDLDGQITLDALAGESFIMQLGAGMEVGWGKVTAAKAYELLEMQAYEDPIHFLFSTATFACTCTVSPCTTRVSRVPI